MAGIISIPAGTPDPAFSGMLNPNPTNAMT